MAKKKKVESEENVSLGDSLDQLRAEIEAKWGKGVMTDASAIMEDKQVVIPLGPVLDAALGGGIPEGSWVSISGPPKVGKAQPVWSSVYTPDGPRAIGALLVGDEVCAADGTISRVTGVYPQGMKQVYRITFQGGDDAYSCNDHLWRVKSRYSGSKVLPLNEIREHLYEGMGSRPFWAVELPLPVCFRDKKVTIDPYLLGLLIGDGGMSGDSVNFTTADKELVDAVSNALPPECELVLRSPTSIIDYRVRSQPKGSPAILKRLLNGIGLMGKLSTHKFIPSNYLYNSVEVRTALMQGLMDSDGTADSRGRSSYCSSSKELAENFRTLALSLGHLCRIRRKLFMCNGVQRQTYICFLRSNDEASFFRFSRKKNMVVPRKKKPLTRKIVKITPYIKADCVCISIDHPSGLYLTDNFVVTHNTTSLLTFAAKAQRPEYGGRRIHYFNIEKRIKKKNLGGIKGLDLDPRKFVIYESSQNLILSGKDLLEMAIHVLQSDPGAVVILDSVSALVEAAVLEEGLGTQTRGGGAKLISQFIDMMGQVVPVKRAIVLGVTHIIADTGGRGGKVEKAANRWLYQADVRLKAEWAESWSVGGTKNADGQTVGGKEIGKKVHWFVQESALGPPGIKTVSYLRYGVGIDRVYEVMEMGKAAGLFAMSGVWYGFSFLLDCPDLLDGKEPPKVQGAEKAYALLNANPAWVDVLEERVKSFLSGGEE